MQAVATSLDGYRYVGRCDPDYTLVFENGDKLMSIRWKPNSIATNDKQQTPELFDAGGLHPLALPFSIDLSNPGELDGLLKGLLSRPGTEHIKVEYADKRETLDKHSAVAAELVLKDAPADQIATVTVGASDGAQTTVRVKLLRTKD
jgi:hypothetical protein